MNAPTASSSNAPATPTNPKRKKALTALAAAVVVAGLGNYLNVLTAETSVLRQRSTAVDLAARALDTQVALMRALGGGYSGTDAATASTSTTNAPEIVAIKASKSRATGVLDSKNTR